VRECPNVRGSEEYNKQNGISFHRFPKNPHRYSYLNNKLCLSKKSTFGFLFNFSRDKWTSFCENPDVVEILQSERPHRLVVCSWHFDPTELIGDGRSRLAFNGLVPHLRPPPPADGTLDPEITYAK